MGAHKPSERMKKRGGGKNRMMYNKGTTKNKMPRYGMFEGGVASAMPKAPKS